MSDSTSQIDFTLYKHVACDSRKTEQGGIFIALQGTKDDGHNYIDEAIKNGAKLIILHKNHSKTITRKSGIKYVEVDNTVAALGETVNALYKQPSNIVAVTGTSGKTSVAYFYQQIISLVGQNAASIGTLGVICNVKSDQLASYYGLTTPGAISLHQMLHTLHSLKVDNVILEASSHGLLQHRLDQVKIKAAAFTSFSQDHLDYHPTMEDYLQAKLYLFTTLLAPGSVAVINSEMAIADQVIDVCKARHHKILTYGKFGEYLKILSFAYNDGKSEVDFILDSEKYTISLNFLGAFQIYNILCALCLAIAMGYNKQACMATLQYLKAVPGRMEKIGEHNIFIDFSHKPDALEKALVTLRANKSKNGRVIVVFGCGGDRDSSKRGVMGEVAERFADVVIVTDDNPRTEDPTAIRAAIIAACPKAIEIADRKKAIATAIDMLHPDDLLLIAGKGHEKFQIIGDKHIPFDEHAIVTEILSYRSQ